MARYIRCGPGAGFKVELLPEAAPHGCDVMLQVRLPQLPIPGKLASLFALASAPTIGQGGEVSESQNLSFFVDSVGNVGLVRDMTDGEGAPGQPDTISNKAAVEAASKAQEDTPLVMRSDGRLRPNRWMLVVLELRRDIGSAAAKAAVRVVDRAGLGRPQSPECPGQCVLHLACCRHESL